MKGSWDTLAFQIQFLQKQDMFSLFLLTSSLSFFPHFQNQFQHQYVIHPFAYSIPGHEWARVHLSCHSVYSNRLRQVYTQGNST